MDRHWGRDSPPRGHRHHLHPVLETVSDRQAGVPAGRHDRHPAETEGRVPSVSDFMFRFIMSVFQSPFSSTVDIFEMGSDYRNMVAHKLLMYVF